MKILFSFLFALSLSSCGTIAGVESSETRSYRNQMLQPGVNMEAFKRVWGEPQSVDYIDGTYSAYYENRGEPVYVMYRDNKIVGWKNDLHQARAQQTADQERKASAWKALGDSVKPKTTTSCTSVPNGFGGFRTDCQ